MSWEFCTDPDFEAKLEWAPAFVRDEVMPLEVLDLDEARLRELTRPLQEEVKNQGLWGVFLPPNLGGSSWCYWELAVLRLMIVQAVVAPAGFGVLPPLLWGSELINRLV